MKASILRVADALGAASAFAWRHRRLLPILMYHGVVQRPLPVDCWHMLPLADFTRQLEWLARRYRVLPLAEALERLQAGDLPPRCAAITFDDGYLNNRELAYPVLERLGLPATIFVVTSVIGTREPLWPDRLWLLLAGARCEELDLSALGLGVCSMGSPVAKAATYVRAVTVLKALPAARKDGLLRALADQVGLAGDLAPGPFRLMSWDDVRALQATGLVAFGPHTTHHDILRHQSDAEVERAIGESQERLARETGTSARVFAYPNGRAIDFDQRAREAVQRAGIRFALSTENGLAARGSEPLALPRVSIGSRTPMHRFRLQVSGALWRS